MNRKARNKQKLILRGTWNYGRACYREPTEEERLIYDKWSKEDREKFNSQSGEVKVVKSFDVISYVLCGAL